MKMKLLITILCICTVNSQDETTMEISTTTSPETTNPTTTTQSTTQTTTTNTTTHATTTPIECGPNSVLALGGYDCASCANKTAPCSYKQEEKCYCNQGYVRDNRNNCILSTGCNDENTCDLNESYAESGIDCLTCSNYQSQRCPLVMRSACYCKVGYVRVSNDNRKCVKLEDCANELGGENDVTSLNCPPNSVYMTTHVNCKKCGLEYINCSKYPPGCYCKSGLVNYNGRCVSPYQCPVNHRCVNRLNQCRGCYRTCTRSFPVYGYKAARCVFHCGNCMCPAGYVTDSSGNCQPQENCRDNSYVLF